MPKQSQSSQLCLTGLPSRHTGHTWHIHQQLLVRISALNTFNMLPAVGTALLEPAVQRGIACGALQHAGAQCALTRGIHKAAHASQYRGVQLHGPRR